jgi:hypothetical protein
VHCLHIFLGNMELSLYNVCVLLCMKNYISDVLLVSTVLHKPMIKMSYDISERDGPIIPCALYKHISCADFLVWWNHLFALCMLIFV